MNRRAAHAATDIEHRVAVANSRLASQGLGELLLGLGRRFLAIPKPMVNVPPPEKPIEGRRQIIMLADKLLRNTRTLDHRTKIPFKRFLGHCCGCPAGATGGGMLPSLTMYASP